MSQIAAISESLDRGEFVVNRYLEDLDDTALLVRPIPGMNPIAWQLGHLISSERRMVESVKPGSSPALPEGFEAAHGKEASTSDDASKYPGKAEYLRLMQAQRAATKAALASFDDAGLAAPAPESMTRMCKTVGSVFILTGDHLLMHVGQWVAVRRKLGKPVAF